MTEGRDAAAGFALHEQLAADTIAVGELPLSRVLLMDDARFPWLLLVPRRASVVEFLDLSTSDCAQLLAETRQCAEALRSTIRPHKLNVAALGNVVAQLHVHIVARFRTDVRWPQPVWGAGPAQRYAAAQAQARIAALREALRIG